MVNLNYLVYLSLFGAKTVNFIQMKRILFLFLLGCLASTNVSNATNAEGWLFQTKGIVTASQIIEENVLFCGSSDSVFYALNAETGKLLWSFSSPGEIKSEALIVGQVVVFNTQSTLVALNKITGALIWQYKPTETKDSLFKASIDEWDYHASSPILYNSDLYYGDDFGNVHKVNSATGSGKVLLNIEAKVAIHAGVCIKDDILYFGDWNGTVYAYSLKGEFFLWAQNTFDEKPYSSYGSIITKPLIYKNKLYVGARNYDFTVLNIKDGSFAWQFNEPTGGWITGTPLIVNDTLYMGGSDNKAMIAFNANNGEVYWEFKSKQNIFCKPIYREGVLFFTDGDSYNHFNGEGYLYAINATNGVAMSTIELGRNSYSSPIINANMIYFGAFDGKIHAISIQKMLGN